MKFWWGEKIHMVEALSSDYDFFAQYHQQHCIGTWHVYGLAGPSKQFAGSDKFLDIGGF